MLQPPSQPTQQQPSHPSHLPPEVHPAQHAGQHGEPTHADLTRQRYFIKLAPPTVTYILIGLNLIGFAIEIIWGIVNYQDWNGSQNINVLVDTGAKVNEYIALGSQYWRLFTAMFLHIGILHLLFNLYALYAIGSLVESYYGHWRYAVIYLLGGLFGSLGSYMFSDSVSAGASGAIFAITGAAAVYFFLYRDNFGARGRAVLQNIVIVIVVNMAFGVAGQGVDNWGHAGGLIGGLLLGYGLAPRYEPNLAAALQPTVPQPMGIRQRTGSEVAWILLCVVLFAAATYWRTTQLITTYLPILGS
jgi:membrane associated rhomboid family serine protease